MTGRLAVALIAAPCALFAQLELYVLHGSTEQRVTDHYDVGAAVIGETLDTQFRLRNPGPNAVDLGAITADGVGFSVPDAPASGGRLLPNLWVDFTARFQPVVALGHSAPLRFGSQSVLLLGTGLLPPALFVGDTAIPRGGTIDLGSVQSGANVSRTLTLRNPNQEPLSIAQLAVSGQGFTGPGGVVAPFTLGQSAATFTISWTPLTAGDGQGTLTVGRTDYALRGTATDPPFPKLQIVLDPPAPRSGQQAHLSIRLAAASGSTGSGQLRLEFQGASDPAVGFLSPKGLAAAFTVRQGDDSAHFGPGNQIDFQTGSTAGAIVLTATLGAQTDQTTIQLAPSPVVIDTAAAVRSSSSLTVTVSGFDNTRSAGPLGFTFLDRNGQALAPVRADVTAQFKQHFDTANAGGLFSLRAVFGAAGAVAAVDSVDIEFTNSAGVVRRNVKMTE